VGIRRFSQPRALVNKLYVLYDAQSDTVLRWYAWLYAQPASFPLEFVPFQASEQMARFGDIERFRTEDGLLAISDEGAVYAGPGAFIMCLYALPDYQEWAFRLSISSLQANARRVFDLLTTGGKKTSRLMGKLDDEKLLGLLQYQCSASSSGTSDSQRQSINACR